MRRLRGRTVQVLVAVVAVLGLVAVLAAPAFADADDAPAGTARDEAGQDGVVGGPVVLVGLTGVRWDDVRTLATPGLWDLSRSGALGNVAARSIRSASCPADGWLGVSAGTRLGDLEDPELGCRTLREVRTDGTVPGWADYVLAADEQPYRAEPGRLGATLAEAGTEVLGVGPGAAIALADLDGTVVGQVERTPATSTELYSLVRTGLRTNDLVVVDAGSVRDPGRATEARPERGLQSEPEEPDAEEPESLTGAPEDDLDGVGVILEPTRLEQVRAVDERVETVLRAARSTHATVLVVSLADSGRPTLQLAAAHGTAPGGEPYRGLLTSGATRQPGLVQAIDVTPTVVSLLGLDRPGDAFDGAPMVPTAGPDGATARIDVLEDMATEARQVTRVSGSYLTRVVLTQAVFFVLAALLLTVRTVPAGPPLRPALRALRVAGLALGAAPVASFLAGLVPWWRAGSPTWAFWGAILGWIALITAVALRGPWRHRLLGPAGVVSGVTVLVLLLDALTGATLVIDSPMGAHRIMAARFYGMSNQAFALLTAASLLVATAVAQPLLDRGRRRAATLAVAGIGLVVVVVNGTPGLGSDFGGPPALILGFAILTLAVSGRKVRWRTLLLVGVVAAVVVGGFAVLDWLRPPAERTHLGRFFATVMDGGLWDVVVRKLSVNLRVLTSWRYLVLAIGGVLVTLLVLRGPHPRGRILAGRSPLAGLGQAVPLLGTTVAAVGAALGLGFLINDSGIVVPATGIAVAVPCLVAAAAQWRLEHPDVDLEEPAPERSGAG